MPKEKQLRYDKAYLRIAEEWGKLSHCKRKQVGALIVKDRMIISDGYNGTPTGFENYCEDDDGYTKWYVLHATVSNSVDILLALFLILGGVIGAQFGVLVSRKVTGARARIILALLVLGVCTQLGIQLFLHPYDLFVMVVQ